MKKLLLLFCLSPLFTFSQITAEAVLAKTMSYHDPNHHWSSLNATFIFRETRPSGPDGSSTFILDNTRSYAKIIRGENEYEILGEDAKVLKGENGTDRALMMRNYYLYLWGLPMKLNDSGTPIDEKVGEEEVKGIDCYVLRVPYEKDTWYFSVDKETGRIIQYRFYQDAEENKGELITLEDEIEVQGIKIPQKRSWYTLPEMKYLGTDILERVE